MKKIHVLLIILTTISSYAQNKDEIKFKGQLNSKYQNTISKEKMKVILFEAIAKDSDWKSALNKPNRFEIDLDSYYVEKNGTINFYWSYTDKSTKKPGYNYIAVYLFIKHSSREIGSAFSKPWPSKSRYEKI